MESEIHASVRGIKTKYLAQMCIAVCVLLLAVIYIGIARVDESRRQLVAVTNDCVEGQKCATQLSRSFDYLTEQARMFVITQDIRHMNNYFAEVESGRREDMTERLSEICGEGDPEAVSQLQQAMAESLALQKPEIHAMRLTAYAIRVEAERLPDQVADWEMTKEELAMSSQELKAASYELVYGGEYLWNKTQITKDIEATLDILEVHMEQRQLESSSAMEQVMKEQRWSTFLLMILVCLVFYIIEALIVHPMNEHVRCIQTNKKWKMIGGYEMRYLANIYNRLYDKNQHYQKELEYRAGHDTLTGICNRETFEEQRDRLRGTTMPMALLIIDVDEFKQINDRLGHEAGDAALRCVAQSLERLDLGGRYCVARIGGDEFSMILTRTTPKDYPKIEAEIMRVNQMLQAGVPGVPPLSLSVGVAMSAGGYTDLLFHQADMALYYTKEHGRKGCTLYKEEMDQSAASQPPQPPFRAFPEPV